MNIVFPTERIELKVGESINFNQVLGDLPAERMSGSLPADQNSYDNTESGLDATNVQDAIDELAQKPSVDAYTKQESDAFITDEYSATSTYAIGDMVIHDNALYVCSTAITTAEAWNSAHWTLTDIATAIGTVKTAIPTKTSDLQNDSGFAQIDDSEESASKTLSSSYIENKYATVFENVIGDAGRFKPQNSWYATAGATGYSSSNGVATFTVTAQYGGLRPANPINHVEGHKYYIFGKVKASNKICLSFDGIGAVFSTGSGDWEFISNIYTSPNTRTRYLTISDNNASGFGEVQAKNAGVIDLTAIYGDNVPTKADLDAKIEPMGALSSSATGELANKLYADVTELQSEVETLNDNVDTRTYKVIALGDSITAFGTGSRGWLRYFKEKISCDIIANTAVDGAWLYDKEAGTIYDGNPIAGDNNLNVLGNQVQKILNNNYDAPDLIMIAVGTNSGISITEQQIKEVYFNNGFIALEDVDRTTSAGAYRWCLEKLHTKYPDAIIIWCSPIHGAEPTMKGASQIVAWGESLRIATAITGQQFIESYRCGICGYKEVMNSEGEYLQDGLHPNAKGAKKLGYYNASQVKNILMQVFGE